MTRGPETILNGSAWAEFCDTLKRAGEVIERERSPKEAFDRAEGYRYLSRLARLALEKFVEHNDPATPRFYELSHETAKIGCDNPDSFYQNAKISGEYEYKITGTRGTIHYMGFGTYYGDYGKPGRSGCSGYLEADNLAFDAEGRFELILSCTKHPGNWLAMEPDTSMLIVRQNYLDKANEVPGTLFIERLGAQGPPAPLSPGALAAGLTDAANYVAATAALFADWAEGFMAQPNTLVKLDPKKTGGAHGDPNMFWHMGYWELASDEALIIEGTPPECDYWNFQVNNYWMESLDYRYHQVYFNKHTTRYLPDGSFRFVLAHEDPGVPNWLETAGHRRGTMGLRWVKASSHPTPTTRVVKFRELLEE